MTNQEKINILAKEAQAKFEKAKEDILNELMADINQVTDEPEKKKEPKVTLDDLMEDYNEDMIRLGNQDTEYFGDGVKNIDIAFDGSCLSEEMLKSLALEYGPDVKHEELIPALVQALALAANSYFASINVEVGVEKLFNMFSAVVAKVLLNVAFSDITGEWKDVLKEVFGA